MISDNYIDHDRNRAGSIEALMPEDQLGKVATPQKNAKTLQAIMSLSVGLDRRLPLQNHGDYRTSAAISSLLAA